jgi:CheY-like chemotaxis protein
MAKILLVDDDRELANTLQQWLTHENHSVEAAHCGMEGWQKLSGSEYDLLILDWDLPDVNGIDVLKRLRKNGGNTCVLMLTGHTAVNDKAAGLDAGADDYLTKPFHMTELTARVRALLRRLDPKKTYLTPLGQDNDAVLQKAELAGSLLASRYEFLEVAGEGGLGIVFKARHPMMDKLVAIKMLHGHQSDPQAIERFQVEAKAISRLDHPNIVSIYDFGVTERQQPYMVMEYISGRSLEDMLDNLGVPPLPIGLDVSIQICDGLAHAHEMGILHRDLKPSNVMLKKYQGRPPIAKLLDFGLAKLNAPGDRQLKMTQVGQVLGSPPYMSPEQVRGEPLDQRSDLYSLGCLVYEIVTGCPPHLGMNTQQIMMKHVEEDATPISKLRHDLTYPAGLEQVIAKALSRNPSDRQQTVNQLRDELKQVQKNSP